MCAIFLPLIADPVVFGDHRLQPRLRFWCYTSSKRRRQPASNSDNGPRGTDAEEPCKFRFRDAPGSSPPPAPRWDQHELDRQISDLGTILAAQVVEFETARDLPWINITA